MTEVHAATTTDASGAAPADRRTWVAAVVLMVAALMDLLDGTVVNVALPTIRTDLGAGATALEWVVSGYMLAFAATLVTAGRLGDLYGRRRLFLVGVASFGVASLLSGLAQTPGQLVAARILQGVAAALVAPQVLASFRAMFTGPQRVSAFGMYGAVAGLAAALGVILGGLLTQADVLGLGWRAVFLVNVPVAAAVLVAAVAVVPETRDERSGRLDVLGALGLGAALAAVVYTLLEGRSLGWPAWVVALGVAGCVGLVVLVVTEPRRTARGSAPLLQPRLFARPAFSAGIAVQLVFSLAMQGFVLGLMLWLQAGQHWSPLHAGVTLVFFSVGAILTAPVAGRLAVRWGRGVLVVGALLMAVGFLLTARPSWDTGAVGSWALAPGLLVAGAGLGLLVVPLVAVVLAAVPAGTAGGASGIFSTAQQLGGALGVAVIGGVFFAHLESTGDLAGGLHATVPWAVGAYLLCAALCLALPRHALTEEEVLDA
jgi:EmrB/QacA subfamily drug resistance transporter